MMTFKEKLVVLRKMKNLTQDEFASAVGVSRQAVYKWESGHSYPEAMKLWEIKLLFDISIDNLLDDTFEIELPKKKRRRRKAKVEGEGAEVAAVAAPVEEPVINEEKKESEVKEVAAAAEEPVAEIKPVVKAPVETVKSNETKADTEEVVAEEVEEEVVEEVVEEVEDVLPPVTPVPENPDRVSDLLQKKGFFGRLFGKK